MPNLLSRRNVLTSAALSAGAVALLKGGLTPVPASAQNVLPKGTVHSFSKKRAFGFTPMCHLREL